MDRLAGSLNELRRRWGWEQSLFLLVVLLAAGLRLWALGDKVLHHDESLHAYFSWRLSDFTDYKHDPMMHGPFLFEGTAFMFKVLGDSDFTARLLQAVFGIALVGLPYFLRNQMGRRAALLASLMLAVSPTMLYVSRFARHDMIAAALALALAVCIWRYWADPKPRYLYLGAAALALGFATMEVTFLYGAIFGVFLLAVAGKELWRRVRHKLDFSSVTPPAAYALLLGSLVLPLLVAFFVVPFRWLGTDLSVYRNVGPVGPCSPFSGTEFVASRVSELLWLRVGLAVALLAVGAVIGWRWHLRRWLVAAGIFWVIYFVLYTTLLDNMSGFATGLWGSVDYWVNQHEVRRGCQPWFYFTMLLSTYEFLPLLFALMGAVYFTVKGDMFSRFLVWWAFASLLLFSYSGEKMPWLTVHMALPLILLAARFLGEMFKRGVGVSKDGLAVAGLAVVPFAVKTSSLGGIDVLWIGALVLGAALYLAWKVGAWQLARSFLWVLFAALLVLSTLVAQRLSFQHSDIPVELAVYTQSSPDIKHIKNEIDRLAQSTGEGRNLKVTVDGPLVWPWAWYLRDYTSSSLYLKQPLADPVVLIDPGSESANREQLQGYGPGATFSLRWWFPEYYRQASPQRVLFGIWDPKKWQPWWGYFWHRELLDPIGSSDGVAYFPKDFDLKLPMPSEKWRR